MSFALNARLARDRPLSRAVHANKAIKGILLLRLTQLLEFPVFSRIFYRVNADRLRVADEIWTIRELAAYLKLKEKTAYALASRCEIPGFKVGGSWRFRRSDIDSWIDKRAKADRKKSK